MTASAGSRHGWHEATMLRSPLRSTTPVPSASRLNGNTQKTVIAGVKQSCGGKCARLVDWLSFPPILQIIGKGAHQFLGRMPSDLRLSPRQFASLSSEITRQALGAQGSEPFSASREDNPDGRNRINCFL